MLIAQTPKKSMTNQAHHEVQQKTEDQADKLDIDLKKVDLGANSSPTPELPPPPPSFFNYENGDGNYSTKQLEFLSTYLDWPWVTADHAIDLIDTRLDERQIIEFSAPDGAKIVLLRDKLARRGTRDYSWAGHIEGSFGHDNFVVNGDNITGQVQYKQAQLQLKPLGEGKHVLLFVQPDLYPEDEDPNIDLPNGQSLASPKGSSEDNDQHVASAASSAAGDCPIRIIVVYTDDVAAAHADPRSEIQLATDYYNNANVSSSVDHSIELARIVEISYAESGSSSTDLNRFRLTNDGFLDDVHALRTLYDADMCMLIPVDGGGFCGVAYLNSSATTAFGVTAYGCMAGNLSFAHEFGHMYGARHDIGVDPNGTDNHGVIRPGILRRSIMSYSTFCSGCQRIQYWSNNGVMVLGQTFGDVGTAENFNELNNSETTVRGFRTTAAAKTHNQNDVVYGDEEANARAIEWYATDATKTLEYESGSKGMLVAGDSLTFRTGFHAKAGADVVAKLEGCNVPAPRPAARFSFSPGAAQQLDTKEVFNLFPNPAGLGAEITIDFSVETEGFVGIEVYRVDGARVETVLYTPGMAAGNHRITYGSGNLSAGNYFMNVSTATSQATKPFTVVIK